MVDKKKKILKILMIGDDKYKDTTKIKDILFQLRERYGADKFKIATFGGDLGVDRFVRNDCFKLGLEYGEFQPYHNNYGIHCIMPEQMFGKMYDPRYYFWREDHAVKWANIIMIFLKKESIMKFDRVIKKSQKLDKKIKVFYDKRG